MDPAERGAEIRRLRKAAGLAQWHVAAEFGISDPAVSQWEKGETKPDYRKLIRLDELYHCNGEILALFELGVSWRDEAARLQEQLDELRALWEVQEAQLARLAGNTPKSKPRSRRPTSNTL